MANYSASDFDPSTLQGSQFSNFSPDQMAYVMNQAQNDPQAMYQLGGMGPAFEYAMRQKMGDPAFGQMMAQGSQQYGGYSSPLVSQLLGNGGANSGVTGGYGYTPPTIPGGYSAGSPTANAGAAGGGSWDQVAQNMTGNTGATMPNTASMTLGGMAANPSAALASPGGSSGFNEFPAAGAPAADGTRGVSDQRTTTPFAQSQTSAPINPATGQPYQVTSDPNTGAMPGGSSNFNELPGAAGPSTSIANPNTPAYPLNVGAYLNPEADYMQSQALKNIQATYAGQGNLLSGPAMKGISDYSENMAMGNAWNPAVATAAQQQQFGQSTNAADRQFQYNAGLNDQTIPFQQQMSLAQLGMTGTQGQQSVANLLATLLGQNAQNIGQAQGTGTIGGSNAISNAISQAISQYLSNSMLNRAFPSTGGP